jgi:hypothetical protein
MPAKDTLVLVPEHQINASAGGVGSDLLVVALEVGVTCVEDGVALPDVVQAAASATTARPARLRILIVVMIA